MSSTIASSTTSLGAPARLGLRHGEPKGLAAPPEVEAGLLLDDHREIGRQARRPARRRRAGGTAAAPGAPGTSSADDGARGDHEHVVGELAGIGALAHLHPTLGRAPDELARDFCRLGDAVLAADDRGQHVVRPQAAYRCSIHVLDRDAETALQLGPLEQARRALRRSSRRRGIRPARSSGAPSSRKSGTLSRTSATSAAVENCWRTPPIAFPVAPEAISARSASTTSRAPRSARWYAMLAPTAPAPATTIRPATRRAPVARRRSAAAAARARPR